MTILLIAEARSGSTNLAKWLKKSLPDFNLLNEPFNFRSSDFVGNNRIIDYTKDNIISEKYFFNESLINDMIEKSDIVFCLKRERLVDQLESYIVAHKTNNWYDEYNPQDIYENIEGLSEEIKKFVDSKKQLSDFVKENNIKTFTYENLYYENGIQDLKTFLNIKTDVPFPYGKKYRKDINKKTVI